MSWIKKNKYNSMPQQVQENKANIDLLDKKVVESNNKSELAITTVAGLNTTVADLNAVVNELDTKVSVVEADVQVVDEKVETGLTNAGNLIRQETVERTREDTALTNAINTERTERIDGDGEIDTRLSQEIDNRTNADTALSDRITALEEQGGGGTPANMVTTDTEQYISGFKHFTAPNGIQLPTLIPTISTETDIGRLTHMWNDLFLSGRISDATNSVKVADIMTTNTPQTIQATKTFANTINTGRIEATSVIRSQGVIIGNDGFNIGTDNTKDICTSNTRARNIYVAGNVSDGTNTITVAEMVNKADKTTVDSNYTNLDEKITVEQEARIQADTLLDNRITTLEQAGGTAEVEQYTNSFSNTYYSGSAYITRTKVGNVVTINCGISLLVNKANPSAFAHALGDVPIEGYRFNSNVGANLVQISIPSTSYSRTEKSVTLTIPRINSNDNVMYVNIPVSMPVSSERFYFMGAYSYITE